MDIAPEQVERLKQSTGATEEEARAALRAAGGDLLEAVLWLERQGKRPAPSGGTYSTRPGGETGTVLTVPASPASGKGAGAEGTGRRLWAALVELFRQSMRNRFEVVRRGVVLVSIPVLVLAVLVLAAFWVVVPLAVVGLFCGCHYYFSGAELGRECIHNVMASVAETAERIKRHVKNDLGKNP